MFLDEEKQSHPALSVDEEELMMMNNEEETHRLHPQHDAPLRIKLKLRSLPKSSECWSDDDDEENRACKLCNKGFSSGRALGGHMRVHYQMPDVDEDPPPPRHSSSSSSSSSSSPKLMNGPLTSKNISTTCTECGKTFPSLKALFGHMRCHPEREWRGILPPPNYAKININSQNQNIDHPPPPPPPTFPSWSVTAKRGRKSIGSIDPGKPISELAVCGLLLMLANKTTDHKTDFDSSKKRKAQERQEDEEEEEEEEEEEDHPDQQGRVEEEEEEEKGKKDNSRKKKKLLKDLQMVEEKGDVGNHEQSSHAFPDRYKCTTCNKSFPTHQALGGHKSSHNKLKITTAGMGEELALADAASAPAAAYETVVSKGFDGPAAKTGESLHRCQICQKTFPTGQALGGHKRCHWTGPAEPHPNNITSSATVVKEFPGQIKRPAVEFDLNELPQMDEVVVSDSYQITGNHELVDYPYSSSSFSSAA